MRCNYLLAQIYTTDFRKRGLPHADIFCSQLSEQPAEYSGDIQIRYS